MIFLSPPHMSGKELEYIQKVFDSNYIAPLGEYVDRFEHDIKTYTGAKNALAVVSGTSAIHLALRVIGIKSGDSVAVSSFTFIGSVTPVLYQNAKPIFIDSDESWNMSPKLLKKAIEENEIKAVVLTHLYGQMAKIEEISQICKQNGVYLIEDAAESLGATYKQRQSGTFGDFGIYSFNGNKILTTSGGGMLVSDNDDWMKKARFLSTQAKEKFLHYEHEEFGYNYRMSNVLAAIGVAQMEVLSERVKRKREIFDIYKRELSEISDFMPEIENSMGNRWLTTSIFKEKKSSRVIEFLRKKDIESRPLWKPMHMQPLFRGEKSYVDGKSEEMFRQGICLPSGSSMSDSDVSKVIKYVKMA